MDKNELLELRNQVVASARASAADGDAPAEDRLPILLELARDGDVQLLKKAFELAGAIADASMRLDAMLDIIAVIDENLAKDDNQTSEDAE